MRSGLIIVSFGTSVKAAREKNLIAIEKELKQAFPDRLFMNAWTSGRIISRVMKEEGLKINTLKEALEKMKTEAVEDLLVQPTHLMEGMEYELLKKTLSEARADFKTIKLGMPLLYDESDIGNLAGVLPGLFPYTTEKDMVIFMGHGSKDKDNSCYKKLDEAFKAKGHGNFRIALVEADPGIERIIAEIKERPDNIYLSPLMVVAGDHAINDMAGEAEDSWKNILEKKGYNVKCVLKGLGEYEDVRRLYVEHGKKAVEI